MRGRISSCTIPPDVVHISLIAWSWPMPEDVERCSRFLLPDLSTPPKSWINKMIMTKRTPAERTNIFCLHLLFNICAVCSQHQTDCYIIWSCHSTSWQHVWDNASVRIFLLCFFFGALVLIMFTIAVFYLKTIDVWIAKFGFKNSSGVLRDKIKEKNW